MSIAVTNVYRAHRLLTALPRLCTTSSTSQSISLLGLAARSVFICSMHSLVTQCSCPNGLSAATRHGQLRTSEGQTSPRLPTGLLHAIGHTSKHRHSHHSTHTSAVTNFAVYSDFNKSRLSEVSQSSPEQPSSAEQQPSNSSSCLPPSAFRRRRRTSSFRAPFVHNQHIKEASDDHILPSIVDQQPQQQGLSTEFGNNGTAASLSSVDTSQLVVVQPRRRSNTSTQLGTDRISPLQQMRHRRNTSASSTSTSSSTSHMLAPSPNPSSSSSSNLAVHGSNGHEGSDSALHPGQHSQQQMLWFPRNRRPESSRIDPSAAVAHDATAPAASTSPVAVPRYNYQHQQQQQEFVHPAARYQQPAAFSHPYHHHRQQQQQQQQQQWVTQAYPHHWQEQQQQQQHLTPPELLQPPPPGPLLIDISAMLSWTEGSPPGHESWAARHLPPDLDLDRRRLLWVAVNQPGGPGSSAAIWVGKTFLKTLDKARSDHAADQDGSVLRDSEHAGPGLDNHDHDDDHEVDHRSQEGIILREDLIRSSVPQVEPQQQQQQQQEAEAMLEHEGQQQHMGRRRRRIKQQKQQKQRKQRRHVLLGQHWLEVQQRPHLGAVPAAVVEGLTFPCSSGSSSSSNGGSCSSGNDDECIAGSEQQQKSATVAAAADHDASWFDYLLLVAGDFSVHEHENMFPNCLVHCSDGRIMFDARGPHDIASFVAEAHEPDLRSHMMNLIRIAWDKKDDVKYGPEWVLHRLRQRWGVAAMERFGVGMEYLNARVLESGVVSASQTQQDAAAGANKQ